MQDAMTSSIRILTSSDVDSIIDSLSPELALESQSHVFQAYSSRNAKIQVPQRISTSSEGSTILYMPSRAPTLPTQTQTQGEDSQTTTTTTTTTTACKIVAVPSGLSSDGIPGTTIILDDQTGKVKALVNARKLTALRNAAGSALFLRAFPQSTPPKEMIAFGSGAQILFHSILILKLYPSIKNLSIVIRKSTDRSKELISKLQKQFPTISIKEIISSPSTSTGTGAGITEKENGNGNGNEGELEKILNKVNIIITATPSLIPLFHSTETVPKKGTRIICIGSYKPTMHEIDRNIINRSKKRIIVDSKEACLMEAGEFIDANLTEDDLLELGSVLLQQQNRQQQQKQESDKEEDLILFKSVGLGIQDVAIAKLVLDQAEQRGLGTIVQNYD